MRIDPQCFLCAIPLGDRSVPMRVGQITLDVCGKDCWTNVLRFSQRSLANQGRFNPGRCEVCGADADRTAINMDESDRAHYFDVMCVDCLGRRWEVLASRGSE